MRPFHSFFAPTAGCLFEFCYETVFDNFMAEMQSVAKVSELPWMTMPGNHEADCHDPACFAKKEYRDVSPEAHRFLFSSLSLLFFFWGGAT
jgi:hypothetical protein